MTPVLMEGIVVSWKGPRGCKAGMVPGMASELTDYLPYPVSP